MLADGKGTPKQFDFHDFCGASKNLRFFDEDFALFGSTSSIFWKVSLILQSVLPARGFPNMFPVSLRKGGGLVRDSLG